MLPALVAALVFAAVLGLLLLPLVSEAPPVDEALGARLEREDLETERRRLVATLRDLDLDLAMGKVTPEDHATLRASFEERALRVLAALETRGASQAGGDA